MTNTKIRGARWTSGAIFQTDWTIVTRFSLLKRRSNFFDRFERGTRRKGFIFIISWIIVVTGTIYLWLEKTRNLDGVIRIIELWNIYKICLNASLAVIKIIIRIKVFLANFWERNKKENPFYEMSCNILLRYCIGGLSFFSRTNYSEFFQLSILYRNRKSLFRIWLNLFSNIQHTYAVRKGSVCIKICSQVVT